MGSVAAEKILHEDKNSIISPINAIAANNANYPMDNGSCKRKRPAASTKKLRNLKNKKILTNDDDNLIEPSNDEELNSSLTSISTNVSSTDSTKSESMNRHENINKNISSRQPPIVVLLDDKHTAWNIRIIVNKICTDATVKNNGKFTTIIVNNLASHEKIIDLLRNELIEFHTYQRKEDRKPKIVLKGLPMISTDLIHEELIKHKINPLSIQLIRAKTNYNINIATYLLTVSNINELKIIKNIKQLFNVIVVWEQYHKSNKPTQCFNCQEYGHGKQNCFKTPNCLKCAGKHLTLDCNVNDETTFKCVNCDGNHKASYNNCPSLNK